MATYNKSNAATVIVRNKTIPYYGNGMNQFFGASSDYVTMLYFGPLSASGDNEVMSAALLTCDIKGDTTAGNGSVTLGLISSAWDGSHAPGAEALLSYLTGVAMAQSLNFTTTPATKVFNIGQLVAVWLANPSAYCGIYLRNNSLPLARVGAANCSIEVTTVQRGTPTAPGSFQASPTEYASGSVGLQWNASTVENDTISAYEIQYATSTDGVNWSGWVALKSVGNTATSDAPSMSIGQRRKYRVRANTYGGQSSAWTESNTITRINTAANEPQNLRPPPGWYNDIDRCQFDGVAGSVSTYVVQYSIDSGLTWTGDHFLSTQMWFPVSGSFAQIQLGHYFIYRAGAIMTNGDRTPWATSGQYWRNFPPDAPEILSLSIPAEGSIDVYGGAWLIIRSKPDVNEGHMHTLQMQRDGGEWIPVEGAINIVGEQYIALRLRQFGTYALRDMDEYDAPSSIVSFELAANSFEYTDAAIVPGTTPPRAAHINELRHRVEALCLAYGMEAPVWAAQITAGETSARGITEHMEELRSAAERVIQHLNALGAGVIVPPPVWADSGSVEPRADAMMQLRSIVDQL